jgi:tetratricopeptide (TPR) repeat protein
LLKSSLLLALFVAAGAANPADIAHSQDLAYRQQYDSALAITAAAIARDGSDPAAYYWQGSIIQLVINDLGRGELVDSFYKLSDRAVALCRKRLGRNPCDAEAQFYYGMTQLNRARQLGWQRRTLSALRTCFDVNPHLNAALRLDPSLTDARLGLGVIEYFKVSANRYVGGLGVFGSRKKAYSLVTAVAEDDGMLGPAARFLLAYMLNEDGDCAGALYQCRKLLGRYEGNRLALRHMRDALYKAERYSEAVKLGAQIDSILSKACADNKYGMAENWIVCGKAYAQMGLKREARERFDYVIAWEPYQTGVPWLPHYVCEAKQWRKKLGS